MKDDQSELFTQVDKSDNVIGPITRKIAHKNKTIIHRSIGIFIVNKLNEMLFQKRSAIKDKDPGMWAYSVGGHVTYNDDYKTSAKRELFEELGINLPLEYIDKSIIYMPTETEFTAFFKAKLDTEIIKTVKDEITEIKWVPIKELLKFINSNQVVKWTIDGLSVAKYI